MDDTFELPVIFNNENLTFKTKLLNFTFTYKIEVDIYGTKIQFERDEERNWRALISYEELDKSKTISKGLLSSIVQSIDELWEKKI